MLEIFVDGDACPVKDETYVVATRYGVPVALVSNSRMHVPEGLGVELVLVGEGPDAADDWIAERATSGDIVITTDIPLAARCLERGARVLGPKGREFTESSIGTALAKRQLLSELREMGEMTGGPAPLEKKHRSQYLQLLDRVIQTLRRTR